MKGLFTLTTLLICSICFAQSDTEEQQIRNTITTYFEGVMEADADKIRKSFHPDADIIRVNPERNYSYGYQTLSNWIQFTKRPAPSFTEYENSITSLDRVNNMAFVKTKMSWPKLNYIDYLILIKDEGQWKIINKVWEQEDK